MGLIYIHRCCCWLFFTWDINDSFVSRIAIGRQNRLHTGTTGFQITAELIDYLRLKVMASGAMEYLQWNAHGFNDKHFRVTLESSQLIVGHSSVVLVRIGKCKFRLETRYRYMIFVVAHVSDEHLRRLRLTENA